MKKKISRRIAMALLLALALAVLSGCHGKEVSTGFTVPETFDTETPVEIVFWAKNDTNRNQVAVYQQAIDGFQQLYPNVKVTMRLYTDYSRIYNDVITNISTGTTPNVCITYPDHIATYMTGSNTVVPLDTLMADSRYGMGGSELRFEAPTREEMVPEFLQECVIDGRTCAVPSEAVICLDRVAIKSFLCAGIRIADTCRNAAHERGIQIPLVLKGALAVCPDALYLAYTVTDNVEVQLGILSVAACQLAAEIHCLSLVIHALVGSQGGTKRRLHHHGNCLRRVVRRRQLLDNILLVNDSIQLVRANSLRQGYRLRQRLRLANRQRRVDDKRCQRLRSTLFVDLHLRRSRQGFIVSLIANDRAGSGRSP